LIVKAPLFEANCLAFVQEFIKGQNYLFPPPLVAIMNIAKMDEKKKTNIKATTYWPVIKFRIYSIFNKVRGRKIS